MRICAREKFEKEMCFSAAVSSKRYWVSKECMVSAKLCICCLCSSFVCGWLNTCNIYLAAVPSFAARSSANKHGCRIATRGRIEPVGQCWPGPSDIPPLPEAVPSTLVHQVQIWLPWTRRCRKRVAGPACIPIQEVVGSRYALCPYRATRDGCRLW